MWSPKSLVFIPEEWCYGRIVGPMGAYFSNVKFIKNGVEYDVVMENTEFVMVDND